MILNLRNNLNFTEKSMLNVKTLGIFAILLFDSISTAFVIMSSFHMDV